MANEDERVNGSLPFSHGMVEHETIVDPEAGEVRCFRDAQGHEASASRFCAWAWYASSRGSWVPLDPNEPQKSDVHRIAIAHHRALAGQAAA